MGSQNSKRQVQPEPSGSVQVQPHAASGAASLEVKKAVDDLTTLVSNMAGVLNNMNSRLENVRQEQQEIKADIENLKQLTEQKAKSDSKTRKDLGDAVKSLLTQMQEVDAKVHGLEHSITGFQAAEALSKQMKVLEDLAGTQLKGSSSVEYPFAGSGAIERSNSRTGEDLNATKVYREFTPQELKTEEQIRNARQNVLQTRQGFV